MSRLHTVLVVFILHFPFSILHSVFAQSLSPLAKVSLLTMAPGKELYTSFGHTAIWVQDPIQGLDRVYNYGTFEFRADNFYWKFIRNILPYHLSAYPFQYAIAEAQVDNRSLTEQVLNLSLAQKQRLFDLLETNYRPENREYSYKFYYDNCATRPRDIIKTAVGPGFAWMPVPELNGKSFRQWMNKCLDYQPFARLGMNLAIGQPADEVASFEGAMYLPDNLMAAVAKAKNGDRPLVSATDELFVAQPEAKGLTAWWVPIAGFLLLIPLAAWLYRRRDKGPFWFDKALFVFTGLVGALLCFLWFGTGHGVPDWNASLLIFLPTHLVAAFLLRKPPYFRSLLIYCYASLGLALLGFILTAAESRSFVVEGLLLLRLVQLARFYRKSSQPAPIA